jgi:putative methionine-R-sulfoxide reductase with GAF domain
VNTVEKARVSSSTPAFLLYFVAAEKQSIGEGVCGAAVADERNQIVEDVREVENYLACSIHTRSELVVLIRDAGRIVGEFDIDSDTVGAFIQEDEALLDEMAALISGRRVASLAASYEAS